MCFDRSFYASYNNTSLNYVHKCHLQFRVCLIFFSVTGNRIYSALFAQYLDLESWKFASPLWPLHTHWWIILSHNSVSAIQKMLTHYLTGSKIALTRDMSSKIAILLSTLQVMQEPSRLLCPNPISICHLARDIICRGKSLRIEQPLQWLSVRHRAPLRVLAVPWECPLDFSPNPASFDSLPVDMSVTAFVILRGQFQDAA